MASICSVTFIDASSAPIPGTHSAAHYQRRNDRTDLVNDGVHERRRQERFGSKPRHALKDSIESTTPIAAPAKATRAGTSNRFHRAGGIARELKWRRHRSPCNLPGNMASSPNHSRNSYHVLDEIRPEETSKTFCAGWGGPIAEACSNWRSLTLNPDPALHGYY